MDDPVRYRGGHLQIIACAGSGKTEAIARRAASLIEEGVEPASIVAFTFTEKAAAELKSRITRKVENALGNESPRSPQPNVCRNDSCVLFSPVAGERSQIRRLRYAERAPGCTHSRGCFQCAHSRGPSPRSNSRSFNPCAQISVSPRCPLRALRRPPALQTRPHRLTHRSSPSALRASSKRNCIYETQHLVTRAGRDACPHKKEIFNKFGPLP